MERINWEDLKNFYKFSKIHVFITINIFIYCRNIRLKGNPGNSVEQQHFDYRIF